MTLRINPNHNHNPNLDMERRCPKREAAGVHVPGPSVHRHTRASMPTVAQQLPSVFTAIAVAATRV